MNIIPTVTKQHIRTFVGEQNFQKGQQHVRDGAIVNAEQQAMALKAYCYGSLPEPYRVQVTFELIETVLKPKYIQPPPENPQFNYIVDIYGKWYHKAFYFSAQYRVASPNPIEPGFEAKFARMQYAGNRRFHLSFMRHTGQWIQLYTDLTVDECIETIRDDPYFSL
jgi:hypothetical protein